MESPRRPPSKKRSKHVTPRTRDNPLPSDGTVLERVREQLRQRTAELAIINSVQQGLASQLPVQDIYDLIGDKIRDIFNAQVAMISLYDPASDKVTHRYAIERGVRVYVKEPQPPGGFRRRILEGCEPLLINSRVFHEALRSGGQPTLPGTEAPRSWLGVPLIVGARATGVISIQNLDRENAFTDSDVRLLQTLANAMSMALENTRLFEETQQRAAELATVNRVSHALASQVESEALIQLAGEQVRETFNADIAYIALLDPSTDWIRFPYTFGETFAPIRYGEGLTSKIIETRQPLLINRDMELRRGQLGATQVGIAVRSYLGVPILIGAQAIGVVSVQSIHQEGRFDEGDQHLLMTIAANVGVAIERAQLYERAQEVAVAQERNRLARDLHDAVTQTLFSASLIADALPSAWESDPEEGRQLLKELRQLSRGALAEMRTLLLELRPAALVETRLGDLLRQLGEAAIGRTQLGVSVQVEGDGKLPPEAHIALYRIAQEALNNVLKHSRATQADVRLNSISDPDGAARVVELSVRDNGRGFDLNLVPSGRLGLAGMRERALAAGAKLTIASQPNCGTEVQVVWDRTRGEE